MCFIQHQHSNLALCFVENFIQNTWTYAGMWQLTEMAGFVNRQILKNYTHNSRGERPPALSDHTQKTRHAHGQHLSPACVCLAVASLLERFLSLTKISIIRAADGDFSLLWCCLVNIRKKQLCVWGRGKVEDWYSFKENI